MKVRPSLSPSTEGNEQSSLPSTTGLLREDRVCALTRTSLGQVEHLLQGLRKGQQTPHVEVLALD